MSKPTPGGRALSKSLASRGYLPIMGVSEPLKPSTRQLCKKALCKIQCVCQRKEFQGQNDVIYVPLDLL